MNDDKTLVGKILAGGTESFGLLVQSHYPKLIGFLYKMGLDTESAESLAEEIFLKAYRNLPRYNDSWDFTTWLYKIAGSSAREYIKRNPENICPSVDMRGFHQLNPLLSAIHTDDRSMLVMYYYNRFPLSEIGRIYGLSAESVRLVLNKVRIAVLRSEIRTDRSKCRYNEDFIVKYRTGGVDAEDKTAFENHLNTCVQCKALLDCDSNLIKLVRSEIRTEYISCESIMDKVDKNAFADHEKRLLDYLSLACNARKLWRIAVPALFVFLLVALLAVPEFSKPVWGSVMTLFSNQDLIVNAETEEDYGQPVTLTAASGLASGSDLIRMLNESGTGTQPWQVLYGDPSRMFIWNGSFIVGYRDGAIFQAADLGGLFLSNSQGSSTEFSFPSTGDFFIAGKSQADGGTAGESPGVYLFDAMEGKYLKISESYLNQTAFAWSAEGNYLTYADKKAGAALHILDLKNMKQTQINMDAPVNSLFVSSSGGVSVFTGDTVMMASVSDASWRSESFQYEPFYIDYDAKTVWFISNGAITKHVVGSETNVALTPELPAGSKNPADTFITDWRTDGNYLVCLLKNGDTGLMNLQTGNFSYMSTNREIPADNLPWCNATPQGKRLMFDNNGKFLISSGNDVSTVNISGYASLAPSETRWIDDDRIAYVRMVDEKSPKEGEFSLYTINADTGDIIEVFRSVETELVLNTAAPGSSEHISTKPGGSDTGDKLYETDKATGTRVESLAIKSCKVRSGPGESYAEVGEVKENEVVIYNSRVVNGWCLAQKVSGMLDYYDKTRNAFWIKADNVLLYDKNSLPAGVIIADGIKVSKVTLANGDRIRIILKGDSQSFVIPETTDISFGITGWIDNGSFSQDNASSGGGDNSTDASGGIITDLNSDGTDDTIGFNTDGQHYSLSVNDAYTEGDGTAVQPKIKVVDISSGDGIKEIVVEEYGSSDDYSSTFYYYDGQGIIGMGRVQGLCGNSDAVAGNGTVLSKTRGNILETWFYQNEYILNSQHLLVESARDFNRKIGYKDSAPLKLLLAELPFSTEAGGDALAFVLKQNETVWFVGSDSQGNCLFETPDGRKGWLKISGYQDIPLAGVSAGEAFEGLNTAD